MLSNKSTDILAQQIDRLIYDRLKKANYDKTYIGVITKVLFTPDTKITDNTYGTYLVRYGEVEKRVTILDNIIHCVGERVQVKQAQNDSNRTIISPTIVEQLPQKLHIIQVQVQKIVFVK